MMSWNLLSMSWLLLKNPNKWLTTLWLTTFFLSAFSLLLSRRGRRQVYMFCVSFLSVFRLEYCCRLRVFVLEWVYLLAPILFLAHWGPFRAGPRGMPCLSPGTTAEQVPVWGSLSSDVLFFITQIVRSHFIILLFSNS